MPEQAKAPSAWNPRVLIVAEHASAKFGGEAVLPLHFFRFLRQRGVEAWLLVHGRTQSELAELLPHEQGRITYIPDTAMHRLLWRMGKPLPDRVAYFTVGWLMRLLTQLVQRRLARQLVRDHRIDVVHQPIPVSPKEPSLMFGLGAPVVIGPMNGGMDYPPGFSQSQGLLTRSVLGMGRAMAAALNLVMPGKALASLLLVANERTRRALPATATKRVAMLVENGVDFNTWRPADTAAQPPHRTPEAPTRFVFMGRLVDWKAVNLLIEAFHQAAAQKPMSLTILGDGQEGAALRAQAQALGILSAEIDVPGHIHFTGWQTQPECARKLAHSDALVLPSLMECGGAVVLEAMALGKAVIATDWGGPADYLDARCGILVPAQNSTQFVKALADAMLKLASEPDVCQQMGRQGQEKVRAEFDWQRKVDRILELYRGVAPHARSA